MYIFTLVAEKKKMRCKRNSINEKEKRRKIEGGKKGREREGKRKSQGQYKITEMGPNT